MDLDSERGELAGAAWQELDETQLCERIRARSLAAFEEFVRRHQAVVAGVAYSVCGDFATSEDVAQDAFLTAWQTWSTLREPGRGKAWVCGIARHLAADEHRRRGRRREELSTSSDEEAGESREGEPLELAARNEQQRMVWSALEELPPLYRETLVLFYRDEHSVAAVAEALAITPDAVKQRLARGRELLRHQMTALVESALSTSRPKSSFTASVLAAVAVLSGAAKASAATAPLATASAAGGGVLAKTAIAAATASATAGVIGGLAGTADWRARRAAWQAGGSEHGFPPNWRRRTANARRFCESVDACSRCRRQPRCSWSPQCCC